MPYHTLFYPSHLKVRLRAGGADDKMSDVHVGSPRYIREACFHDAKHDDDLDPVVRRLLSTDDVDVDVGAGESEGDDGATSALSVSFLFAKMLHENTYCTNSCLECRRRIVSDMTTRRVGNYRFFPSTYP